MNMRRGEFSQNPSFEASESFVDTGGDTHISDTTVYTKYDKEQASKEHERFIDHLKPGTVVDTWSSYIDEEGNEKKIPNKNYIIDRKLGAGGMGTTFVARKEMEIKDEDGEEIYGQDVVLKVITSDDVADSKSMQRFRREIQTHIEATQQGDGRCVPINDVIYLSVPESDKQKIAIVMPFVEDGNLYDFSKDFEEKDNDPSVIATIGWEMASALDTMHKKGLAHRDIKPENIFVNKKSFHILLGDFGLTKLIEGDNTTEVEQVEKSDIDATRRSEVGKNLTKHESYVGTLDYISPGAFLNKEDPFQGDLYALGMTLYYLRTGTYPYETKTNNSQELIMQKVMEDPHSIEEVLGDGYEKQKTDALIETMIRKEWDDRKEVEIDGVVYELDTAEHVKESIEKLMKINGWKRPISEFTKKDDNS